MAVLKDGKYAETLYSREGRKGIELLCIALTSV